MGFLIVQTKELISDIFLPVRLDRVTPAEHFYPAFPDEKKKKKLEEKEKKNTAEESSLDQPWHS